MNARPNTDTLDDVMDRKLIVAMDQYIRLTPNEVALPVGWATTHRFGYFFGEGTAAEWNKILHLAEYITPAIGGWNLCGIAFTIADRCQDGVDLGWDISGLTHQMRRDKIPLPEPAYLLADQRLSECRTAVRI